MAIVYSFTPFLREVNRVPVLSLAYLDEISVR